MVYLRDDRGTGVYYIAKVNKVIGHGGWVDVSYIAKK